MDILSKTWEPHDMPMTPHLIYPFVEACTKTLKRIAGFGYNDVAYFIKDKQGRWGYCEEDIDRIGEHIFNNPDKVLKFAGMWPEHIKKFEKVCKKVKDLPALSDNDLLRTYKEFYIAYIEMYAIPTLANAFDFYFENWLKARVLDQNDFVMLTSPSKESFTQKEQKELLSIKKDKNFDKNIEKHTKKYFWLGNNYAYTKILGKDFFIRRFESEKYIPLKKIDKTSLLKKYKISPKIMHIAEESIYWRDERKKYNLVGDHYLNILLEEIGKRSNISLDDMKYTLPYEIENIDKKKISERKQAFLLVTAGDSEEIYTGDKAIELNKKMYPEELPGHEMRGRPACLGKAKGVVKVIMGEKDFHKMQDGDILVTSMTRPEFVPLMKKAVAIITDEGGITCHAAIVSRELSKPCIISTRIATKFFKDGDKVEVDADNGIVRRI